MLAPGVSTTSARAPTANGVIRECSPALCSHAFGVPKQMDVLRHYCLLCSRIGEPRWAAVGMGARVVDTPGASVVGYDGVLARSPLRTPRYSTQYDGGAFQFPK